MSSVTGQLINADLLQIQGYLSDISKPLIAPAQGESAHGHAGAGFADRMLEAVRGVNQQDHLAAEKMAAVDSGASDDLVGAMLSSQEASLSFSMLMQVRNKVMGAMEDLIKLPI
ncbi:flagellar hook-basal body protein [Acidovorax sp. SRB_14]|uniref:flagellar hook-basal body complex protein FliE n=1 Tax=Acidovorax sp. SRB_14 TaxID=1962699 RepID=UPI00146D3E9C|nr:flagellar hook-basal body complex protein FliE [Acidovorax sp. SRB_14]NMM79771.1 flagellar hook-basal body protein [Acidovorax sp. SRB_14]NMM84887.1 flagellar hook-basal body protein [Rhodococcus sp. SRB_17]